MSPRRRLKVALDLRDLVDIDPNALECSTYFLQGEHGGPIKIGRVDGGRAWRRMLDLQIGNPVTLRQTRVVAGDHEAELHQRFADYRIRGEWFYPVPLLAEVAHAIAQDMTTDTAAVDLAARDGYRAGWNACVTQFAEQFSTAAASDLKRLVIARATLEGSMPEVSWSDLHPASTNAGRTPA